MCNQRDKLTWWNWLLLGVAATIGIPAVVILVRPGGLDVIQLMREYRIKQQGFPPKQSEGKAFTWEGELNGYRYQGNVTTVGPSFTWQSKERELVPPPLRLEDKAGMDPGLLPRESEPAPKAPAK